MDETKTLTVEECIVFLNEYAASLKDMEMQVKIAQCSICMHVLAESLKMTKEKLREAKENLREAKEYKEAVKQIINKYGQ